jgi:hypothetical protein
MLKMAGSKRNVFLAKTIKANPLIIVSILLLINFIIRIFICSNTELFRFGDYAAYIEGVEKLVRGEPQYLLEGNFLFAISYIGFFAEKFLGSLDYFFVFNCFIASLTGFVFYYLIIIVTGMPLAGIIAVLIQTLYTEYMVFSSVFYTPVIMIFLLSLFLLLLFIYVNGRKNYVLISSVVGMLILYLLSFFFKPELQYLPWFLIVFSLLYIKRNRKFFFRISGLAVILIFSFVIFSRSDVISHSPANVISNSFVFFGHTNYGGDGGEGSFVYPENKARYQAALTEYCRTNNIITPSMKDYNAFHRKEIFKFISRHPVKWIGLQFTKFFRTFGVVPETTSFKVLYTGLFKGTLWLTSIVVVVPVALIILLFILFFNLSALKQLFGHPVTVHCTLHTAIPSSDNRGFLYIYLLLFVYYVIAIIFFGQYQERYRMPLMVVFIIPALSYFIASFNKEQFLKRYSLIIKSVVVVLFLTIWVFQAKKGISNKQRLNKAIESTELQIGK